MHHLHQLIRNLQKPQNGTTKQHDQKIQEKRHTADEQKRKLHAVLHFFVLFFPEIVGKKGAAAHTHTDEDGGQEGH